MCGRPTHTTESAVARACCCDSETIALACAGKRELPAALRNRFTEAYISEPTALADLRAVVAEYLSGAAPNPPLDAVVDFYTAAKHEAVSSPFLLPPACGPNDLRMGAALYPAVRMSWRGGASCACTLLILQPCTSMGAADSLGCHIIPVLSAPTGVLLYPSAV